MSKFLTSEGLTKTVTKIKALIDAAKASASSDLTKAVGELNTTIGTKVTAVDGKDLLSITEAAKLAKLTVSESGVISIDNIPAAALERCVTVSSDAERFALTTDQIQLGDTVRVLPEEGSTEAPMMYLVIDTEKLNSADGYVSYLAVTDWSSVTNIPAKVSNPTMLEIQMNGTPLATYNGMEDNKVVANITADQIGLSIITDEEIDAMFAESATTEPEGTQSEGV